MNRAHNKTYSSKHSAILGKTKFTSNLLPDFLAPSDNFLRSSAFIHMEYIKFASSSTSPTLKNNPLTPSSTTSGMARHEVHNIGRPLIIASTTEPEWPSVGQNVGKTNTSAEKYSSFKRLFFKAPLKFIPRKPSEIT